MSWAEIKKAVNSDLSTPLNEQLGKSGIEVFTSDGTFTVPAGVSTVFVTMYDGGGGGGYYGGTTTGAGGAGGGANGGAGGANGAYVSGGGGAGGYEIQKPLSVISGETYDITVGLGGAQGTSSSPNGVDGGTSSMSKDGQIILATTKQGAGGGSSSNGISGGTYGAGGGASNGASFNGGAGGAYGLGGSGGKAGTSGGAYGAGGGAGGGAGAQGIVVITWGIDLWNIIDFKSFFNAKTIV